MLEIVGVAYMMIECVDASTGNVVNAPYYYGYQCNDGNIYDIHTLTQVLDNRYGVTQVNYDLLDETRTGCFEYRVPVIKTMADNLPCYYKGVIEFPIDDALRAQYESAFGLVLNSGLVDNFVWDIVSGECFEIEQLAKNMPAESTISAPESSKNESKIEPKIEPKNVENQPEISDDSEKTGENFETAENSEDTFLPENTQKSIQNSTNEGKNLVESETAETVEIKELTGESSTETVQVEAVEAKADASEETSTSVETTITPVQVEVERPVKPKRTFEDMLADTYKKEPTQPVTEQPTEVTVEERQQALNEVLEMTGRKLTEVDVLDPYKAAPYDLKERIKFEEQEEETIQKVKDGIEGINEGLDEDEPDCVDARDIVDEGDDFYKESEVQSETSFDLVADDEEEMPKVIEGRSQRVGKVVDESTIENESEDTEITAISEAPAEQDEEYMVTDVTEEEVQSQLDAMGRGEEVRFIPRVMHRKDYVVPNLNESDLNDLYYMVKNGITVYGFEASTINAIRAHFGSCMYPIKVLFDAFTFDEISGMLKLDILDESPTELYDGIYRPLFLYKLIKSADSMGESMILAYIVIKLTYLSTMTQSAVAYEEDEEKESESDTYSLKQAGVKLKNDLYNETNGYFRTFIADEVLNVTYEVDGKPLGKMEYLAYLCQLGRHDKLLKVRESHFTKLMKLKDLSIQINPTRILIYANGIELCPNVIGKMYHLYLENINKYVTNNVLVDYDVRDIPDEALLDGLDYNQTLDIFKTSEDFKHVTNMPDYEYISEVDRMNLKIIHCIVPSVAGKPVLTPVGYICVNVDDIDSTKKYFLPSTGRYISKLNDLKVTFTSDVPVVKKAYNDTELYAFKIGKAYLQENNVSIKSVSLTFDEDFKLDDITTALNKNTDFRTTVLPKFVKDSADSILLGYRALKLYSPIK